MELQTKKGLGTHLGVPSMSTAIHDYLFSTCTCGSMVGWGGGVVESTPSYQLQWTDHHVVAGKFRVLCLGHSCIFPKK